MSTPAPEAPAATAPTSGGSGPLIPLVLVGVGGYLAWFAVHYWRSQSVTWPSDPIKAVLQGNALPTSSSAPAASAITTAYEGAQSQQAKGASPGTGPITGPEPSGPAQNIARMLLSSYGWAASQMEPLIELWTRESGWNANARNTSSGAYGIAQALGHGGADTAAPNGTNEYGAEYGLSAAQAQQANAGSALWQIRWGLGYIKAAYGSPAGAWAHEESAGWY